MNVISVCPQQCCPSPSAADVSSSRGSSSCSSSGTTFSSRRHSSSASNLLSSSFLGRGSLPASISGSSSSNDRCRVENKSTVVCGLKDFIGGDLLGFDLDKWAKDVEDYGSIAIYPPAEGGYEGRYATRLRQQGYHIMNLSARGLGDPEAYLSKIHGVRPAHLGKQAIVSYYFPPEVDYRLAHLSEDCKGLVVWIIEAKVLSKNELQYLALLPALKKKVKVIAECGNWRSFRWKPLREVAGLPLTETEEVVEGPKPAVNKSQPEEKKPPARVAL